VPVAIGAVLGFTIAAVLELAVLVQLGDLVAPNYRPQGAARIVVPLIGAALGWQLVRSMGPQRARTIVVENLDRYRGVWISAILLGVTGFMGFVLLSLILWSTNDWGPVD
jgi:hypothetical protein